MRWCKPSRIAEGVGGDRVRVGLRMRMGMCA